MALASDPLVEWSPDGGLSYEPEADGLDQAGATFELAQLPDAGGLLLATGRGAFMLRPSTYAGGDVIFKSTFDPSP